MAAQKKKEEVIDTSKVCLAKHTDHHHVDYYLYYTDKSVQMPKGTPGDHGTGVCFSSLLNMIRNRKIPPNRLLYIMEDDTDHVKLTLEEKREFVKLSRKHNLLPPYVKYEWVGEEGVSKLVIDISDVSPSLLYAYLCNFRYIREDPGFVRALVYLVNKKDMDFYVAYTICHRVCLQWGGHTVLDYLAGYPDKPNPNDMKLDVKFIAGVYRYFSDPKKYDKRKVEEQGNFNCQVSIKKACNIPGSVHTVDFFSKKLAKAMRLGDKEIKTFLTEKGKKDG